MDLRPARGTLDLLPPQGSGMRALYDAEGARVTERGLQHLGPSEARLAELLVEDPLLLRTPIVRDGARACVGQAEATWKAFAEAAKAG